MKRVMRKQNKEEEMGFIVAMLVFILLEFFLFYIALPYLFKVWS